MSNTWRLSSCRAVAAEIKLRAERRAGKILKETEKNEGGRPAENPLHDERGYIVQPQTLKELGISEIQSHRWQLEAGIPEDMAI